MCAIAGILGQTDKVLVTQMIDKIKHRGPDDSGMFISPDYPIIMSHQRLSIIDLKGGKQPIYGNNLSHAVVGNGEIYNFPQLRDQLLPCHNFSTHSDTEVVLKLYEAQGVSAIEQLEGMYAFAIADGEILILARDPLGIKPLYYGQKRKNLLLFASELKSLSPYCETIHTFPPGSYFHSQLGWSNFYQLPKVSLKNQIDNVPVLRKNLRKTLEKAVVKRLMSNVPIGILLSGGLDSSIIAAIAAQNYGNPLHSFSVGIKGSRDLEAAREVAKYLNTVHHEYILDPAEALAKLPEIIYFLESFDLHLVNSAIPWYFAARLASDHVKVLLTGEGSDELFAGYRYYQTFNSEFLNQELHRSVSNLHHLNLQRVDRMTMAHGIEARVPFLDTKVIECAMAICPKYKSKKKYEKLIEKWILRQTFLDLLPPEIIWRNKEPIDEGSGTETAIEKLLKPLINKQKMKVYKQKKMNINFYSNQEAYYYQIFMNVLEKPNRIIPHVAHWAERSVNN